MSWYDSLLFFHVAGAFLLVAAVVLFWALVVATARGDGETFGPVAATLERPANVIVVVGALATVVFGVWLAIYVDGYELWDGWILASLILWAIGTETGRRAGNVYTRANTMVGTERAAFRRRGLLLHATSSLAFLVVLALMIFKPGA